MKTSTTDQIEGAIHVTTGIVKEKIGQVTKDSHLTAEGRAEQLMGKVQKKVGEIEKVLEP